MYLALKLKPPKVRPLAALSAIDDGLGRAVELGKPVHYTVGIRSLQNVGTIAALGLLRYVAEKCAKLGARLITTASFTEIIPVIQEIYQTASDISARPQVLKSEDIRFLSSEQYAYAAGVLGILTREHVATNLIFGEHAGSCMILAEGGFIAGCYQVGCPSGNPDALQFTSAMGISMDYFLIGEEYFAVAIAAEGEPESLGTLRGQDVLTVSAMILICIGVALETLGVNWFTKLFGGL